MEELVTFPLLAIVGQPELKTALILGLINPHIGGVLLSGPYGVGKTTAVRSLLDIMPEVARSDTDDDGNERHWHEPMRLIELPLNARLEDIVGGINERVALEQQRMLVQEGVLVHAHDNVLYIDEINLLPAHLTDTILDAAAQGRTLVRRGAVTKLYPSRFVLIGSLNPEEGQLRPQILDRFGLRVWVAPLSEMQQRLEIYRRARDFRNDPERFRNSYAEQTAALREEVKAAREILPHVTIPPDVEQLALALIQELRVPSHRAEIALFEGVRARAAADFRGVVSFQDVAIIAPMALRQRFSSVLEAYGQGVVAEDRLVTETLARIASQSSHVKSEDKTPGERRPSAKRSTVSRIVQEGV